MGLQLLQLTSLCNTDDYKLHVFTLTGVKKVLQSCYSTDQIRTGVLMVLVSRQLIVCSGLTVYIVYQFF